MTVEEFQKSDRSSTVLPVTFGALGALLVFAFFVLTAMGRNDWLFEYALDDVYIHLAMAEGIAHGTYGVNPGEIASASSSPLYPFLLVPFAESPIQRWLPLVWNVLALVAAGGALGWVFVKAGLGRAAVVLAAAAPLALAIYVTAFTGMENMLHVTASLATVIGLWRFVETDRVGLLLLGGVFLSSALRLEGIALGLAAGGVVMILGHWRTGFLVMVTAVLPLAVFAGGLMLLGLEPLPNSILAKLGDTGGGGPIGRLRINVASHGGRYLIALTFAVLLIAVAILPRDRRSGYFGLAVGAAGLAHLAFGSIGWMDRYESYANVSLVAALALLLAGTSQTVRTTVVGIALLGGMLTYAPYALPVYAWNPAAIYAQQGQMARFAKAYVKSAVAVNDIGYVAWRNPDPVLDLWGLASREALAVRTSEPADGWAGPLVEQVGARLAMIYDDWLGEAVPPKWVRMGTLTVNVPTAFLGGRDVAFYATDPASAADLRALLLEWQTSLPPRASFRMAEAGG